MPSGSTPLNAAFSLDVLRLYQQENERSFNGTLYQCHVGHNCCAVRSLSPVNAPGKSCVDNRSANCIPSPLVALNSDNPDRSHDQGEDGFVQSERRLVRNLFLLSITSSIALGTVHSLISLDRYFYGPWTFLGLSLAFLIGALSVYYAQACVTRFGPNRILALSVLSTVVFVLVHFSSSFFLFQFGLTMFALCVGPFYAAQLDFITCFISRLVHLTPTIKRYQEERCQRLLHLLLFCPSHIVGHFVFIVLFGLYHRNATAAKPSQDSSTQLYSGVSDILHLDGGKALFYPASNHSMQNCSDLSCQLQSTATRSQARLMVISEPTSSFNPVCVQSFKQQFCDHALYYIFSFNRYQRDLTLTRAVKPFSADFTILLISVFVLIALAALVIIIFMLHRTEYFQVQDPLERSFLSSSIRHVLFRTFHDHHLRLLLPMAFFVGLEQGFFVADFNKLFVSCTLGLDAIGLVMLTRGCVHLVATLLVHEFVRHINRALIVLSGAICQLGVLAILCLWRPNDDLPLYYVISACWALSNAIWETLLLTNILRSFCPDEWNYALLTLYSFTNLGLAASFGVSEFVCLYIKLYSLMAALLIAIVPMKVCELRLSRLEKILGLGSASHV